MLNALYVCFVASYTLLYKALNGLCLALFGVLWYNVL